METLTRKLSNGIVMTLRCPADSTKSPAIILCHGFCGIRETLLPSFAEEFTQAGFSTITFDYRGFGDSDGERGRLVPAMQIDDIISVVNWAIEQPSIDAQRIGLWGTSFGGCHVFGAAVTAVRGGGLPGIKYLNLATTMYVRIIYLMLNKFHRPITSPFTSTHR